MSQRVLARTTLGAHAIAVACACLPTAAQEPAPRSPVRIEGNVAQPISLSLEELKRLPARTIDYAPRGEGGATTPPRKYTGALLRDVITAAKPTEHAPREFRRSYVVASASDGYRVVFSWAELFLSPIGDSVVVAYARDDTPLPENEGPIAIVTASDRGSARHVKWLTSIKLEAIAP